MDYYDDETQGQDPYDDYDMEAEREFILHTDPKFDDVEYDNENE